MLKLTLDTNCLIDVAEDRDRAPFVKQLLRAAQTGEAEVALVASSAAERQRSRDFLSNFSLFEERRTALGFGGLPLLLPIARQDMAFLNHCLFGGVESLTRESEIYLTLFPSSPVEWADYAEARGHDAANRSGDGYARWRNQILDAQAFWAHEHAGHDVFVTSDARFKVLEKHPAFPQACIRVPEEAVALLPGAAL